jgi:hypothetical protein
VLVLVGILVEKIKRRITMEKVTVASHGVQGVHEKGMEKCRSLELADSPYHIDYVTKGEGREFYCITYASKLKPAFKRLDEHDTIFFLCNAEKGRFATFILASEIRELLNSQQTKLTLPGGSTAAAARFSQQCGYACRPGPGTNGSNTAHVKIPVDFLSKWKMKKSPGEANEGDIL